MRIDAHDIALDQRISLAIEGAVQPQGKRTVEALAEMDSLAAAQQQRGDSHFQTVLRDLVAGLLEDGDHIIGKRIAPGVEGGGAVAQHQARLPSLAVVHQPEVDSEPPRFRELPDFAVHNLRIRAHREPRHLRESVRIA